MDYCIYIYHAIKFGRENKESHFCYLSPQDSVAHDRNNVFFLTVPYGHFYSLCDSWDRHVASLNHQLSQSSRVSVHILSSLKFTLLCRMVAGF